MQFHEEFLDTYENNYITNNRKGESLPAAQPFGLRYSEMPAVLSFLTRKVGECLPVAQPFGLRYSEMPAVLSFLTHKVGERFPLASNLRFSATPSSGLKRRPQRLLLVALFLSILPLFAETYVLGGKKGWADVNVRNGITTGKGRYGYESLELDSKHKENDPDTDLLLDFENSEIIDKAGKYKIVKNSVIPSKKSACGKGSGLSRNLGGGIVLFGDETSFFGNENHAGSFMIDFWICPSTVENGEVLMNWRSSRNVLGNIFYQLINISFYQNKVIAVFQNIFDGYTKNSGELVLQTTKSIIPNKWSHHTIAFIEDSGIIEYRIDEKLEAIEYVTDTGHENGTVYPPVMGVAANFELCPNYTGLIDDFYILRSYEEITTDKTEYSIDALEPEHYLISGGRFESKPIMFAEGTTLNSITAETDVPPQTDVHLYVRGGDNYFNWTESYPEWIQVESGDNIENLTGMYFQVAAELFPDGGGRHSPSVTRIALNYTPLPAPLPPVKIEAKKGDGSVTLTWSYSVEDSADGYYIYYGNRPGEYLGRVAAQGPSPIKVGKLTSCTLTGLKNGTIYYFAVAAYSKADSRIIGPLSKEVFARPAQR